MSLDALLHRREPTAFNLFTQNPLLFLSQWAYQLGRKPRKTATPSREVPVRIVCISDTHSQHAKLGLLPDGDILIHTGDLTHSGTSEEVRDALQWLASQPHPHKLFVAGNHNHALSNPSAALLDAFPMLTYLQQSDATLSVRGRVLRVYGSPLTPAYGSWPFQYLCTAPAQAHWDAIPPETDVLVTHGPPAHHADHGSGCAALLAALWSVRLRLHVCGHIHAVRGIEVLPWTRAQAAYERICARLGGWLDLIVVVCGIFTWDSGSDVTTLVNTVSLGGFRDKKVRGAIVIDM